MMSAVLIAVPAAIEIQGVSNIDTTQVGDQLIEASQTAQSALVDYQSYAATNTTTYASYCSSVFATHPADCNTPSGYPGFSNKFDSACSTSSASSYSANNYSWVTASGSLTSKNTQYQFIVDTPTATATPSPVNVIYLYINARVGSSGNYTCTGLEASLAIPLTGAPVLMTVRPHTTYPGGSVPPPTW
jgi:hypothetical protein